MKPTAEMFTGAVEELAAIPFFPGETGARIAIAKQLSKFVDDAGRLRWLVDVAIAKMRKWQGIAELRALYCTRWRAADGVDGDDCTLSGFTPADCEQYHAELAAQACLPAAPEDYTISTEERAEIDALAKRIQERAEKMRMPKRAFLYKAPAWLEHLC